MKKITGKLSLQWRLTLITALLMTVTCILMYFFISQSAVAGMEDLGDYMIRIDNTDSAPITFNMNPSVLFPELSNQLQLTKKLFLTKGLMVTGIIILLSSICTYFISRQALLPLRRLSQEVNKIEAQNLSNTLEVPATNDEISRLTISFNKMLARLDEAFTAQKQFSANAAHELRRYLSDCFSLFTERSKFIIAHLILFVQTAIIYTVHLRRSDMFEYMTAQEAAEKWNVSLRWVQRLCKGNRIEGVMNINRVWLIPKNAEKPADARKKLMKN